jgi:LemA protein
MIFAIVALAVLAASTLYAITIYNSLVGLKHNAGKAWANLEVLLKQRHDELPKLIETCKQHMQFEQKTLDIVTQARAQISSAREQRNMAALGNAEAELRAGVGRLFAVAESYPELQASETFRHLQSRISGLEDTIADRREFYNECVNIHNVRIEQFPDSVVAGMGSFPALHFLQVAAAEKIDVDVKLAFN